jgi:hypothetical protein
MDDILCESFIICMLCFYKNITFSLNTSLSKLFIIRNLGMHKKVRIQLIIKIKIFKLFTAMYV